MNSLDLIKQYVNTGRPIGRSQVLKLPNNLLKTYLRKRLQAANANPGSYYKLSDTELSLLPLEAKREIALKGGFVPDEVFKTLDDNTKGEYSKIMTDKGGYLSDGKIELLNPEQKLKYFSRISDENFSNLINDGYTLSKEFRHYYSKLLIQAKGINLSFSNISTILDTDYSMYDFKNHNELYDLIIKNKENNFAGNETFTLLRYADLVSYDFFKKIANILGKSNIQKLSHYEMDRVINYSKNPDDTKEIILKHLQPIK